MIKDNSRPAKFFRYFQLLLVVFMFFISPILTANTRFDARAQDIVSTPCPVDVVVAGCEPPRIQSLEIIAVRLLYTAWACGGLLFLILLVYVGFLYMTSAGDQGKVETAKKRGGQWIIGILLFFFSQPIVATFMRGLISDNTDCFNDLRDPGFTFFFVDVCTSGDSVTPTATVSGTPVTTPPGSGTPVTGIGSGDDGTGGCCDQGSTDLVLGCYPDDTASISVPAESCSQGNGACASQTSCVPVSIPQIYNFFANGDQVCRCSQRGRTLITVDGQDIGCTPDLGADRCVWGTPLSSGQQPISCSEVDGFMMFSGFSDGVCRSECEFAGESKPEPDPDADTGIQFSASVERFVQDLDATVRLNCGCEKTYYDGVYGVCMSATKLN